jgi:phosphoribosyl-AMP cyclohydrolase
MRLDGATQLDAVDFDRGGGLVPVVTQHACTGEVLMLGFADRQALERTLADGVMWYFSRRTGALWRKGDTSGNVQRVLSLHIDCDADAVLARVAIMSHGSVELLRRTAHTCGTGRSHRRSHRRARRARIHASAAR